MSISPQVTFQTVYFKPISKEEEEINPGRLDKALASWLADRLKERGITVAEIFPEDFGWVIMVSRKPFMLWLGCGNIQDSTTEWTIFLVAEPSLIQRLFKRVNPVPQIEQLRAHMAELVLSIPGVSNILWE